MSNPTPIHDIAKANLLGLLQVQAQALRLCHVVHELDGGGYRVVQQATGLHRDDLNSLADVARLLKLIEARRA